jgi:hypothetical protein
MELMPGALAWTTGNVHAQAHESYVNRVTAALEEAVWLVNADDPEVGAGLAARLESASDGALLRVLLAPETTKRLLWRTAFPVAAVGEFLCRSLTAEAALEGAAQPLDQLDPPLWTALGDRQVLPSGERVGTEPVGDVLAVDTESPYVRGNESLGATEGALPWPVAVDTAGGRGDGAEDTVPWRSLERRELEVVLRDLDLAYRGIAAASPVCATFISTFAKIVAVRTDDHPQFCSFTSGYDLGRIALINPQMLDEVLLAEALVHEAVHSLLFMQDQRVFWGLAWTNGPAPGKAFSPWTGRSLPASTFLQACFVWYALVTFWGHALCAESFAVPRIRARLARAASGFSKGALLDNLDRHDLALLDPDVGQAITDMQGRVGALLEV